jgi:hypothetical protein
MGFSSKDVFDAVQEPYLRRIPGMTEKMKLMRWPAGRMLAAVAIWAAHFGVVYGVTALACPKGLADAVAWSAGVATLLAAIALLGLIVVPAVRGRHPFGLAEWTAAVVGAVALGAILWQASPLLGQQPLCA